ncbi:MAG: polysaccharide biosynthesis/export family protein [Fuerstiella sp.]
MQTFQVQVLDNGEIHLPRSGPIVVDGLTLGQAQQRVNEVLTNGLLQKPEAIISLTEKGTVNVLVLGAVQQPGVHALPRYENDVAHALAAAQGFAEDAGDVIEIHRRSGAMTPSPGAPIAQPRNFSPTAGFRHVGTTSTALPQHLTMGLPGEALRMPFSPETKSLPQLPYGRSRPYVGPVSFQSPPTQSNPYMFPGYSSPGSLQTGPSQMR